MRAWWRRVWSQITGRPLPIPGAWANATFGAEGSATAWIGIVFNDAEGHPPICACDWHVGPSIAGLVRFVVRQRIS